MSTFVTFLFISRRYFKDNLFALGCHIMYIMYLICNDWQPLCSVLYCIPNISKFPFKTPHCAHIYMTFSPRQIWPSPSLADFWGICEQSRQIPWQHISALGMSDRQPRLCQVTAQSWCWPQCSERQGTVFSNVVCLFLLFIFFPFISADKFAMFTLGEVMIQGVEVEKRITHWLSCSVVK